MVALCASVACCASNKLPLPLSSAASILVSPTVMVDCDSPFVVTTHINASIIKTKDVLLFMARLPRQLDSELVGGE
jgi:hypothetical protein